MLELGSGVRTTLRADTTASGPGCELNVHGIRSRERAAVVPALIFPDVEPPVREHARQRLLAGIVRGVPVDGDAVGVERQLVAARDLPEVEATSVLIQSAREVSLPDLAG